MADQGKAAENGEVNTSALRRASNWSQISYGTFIPFFALDSEYLKSLLIGKGYICELEEPASVKSFHGFFPPEITRQDSGEGTLSSSESALNSPIVDCQKASFFLECEFQIRKLFAFMELHLLNAESELAVAVQNVKSACAKQQEGEAKSDVELSDSTKTDLSDRQSYSVLQVALHDCMQIQVLAHQ